MLPSAFLPDFYRDIRVKLAPVNRTLDNVFISGCHIHAIIGLTLLKSLYNLHIDGES